MCINWTTSNAREIDRVTWQLNLHAVRRPHPASGLNLEQLPDQVLEIIVRKMGKRARLLCTKFCSMYGSPGAILATPSVARSSAELVAVIKSWRYRESIKQLDLGGPPCSDSRDGGALAEALPNLCELACEGVKDDSGPCTALTSLRVQDVFPGSQGDLLSFAPSLHSLHIDAFWCTQGPHYRPWDCMLDEPTLPNLRRLHMPLITMHLMDAAFPSIAHRLTNLTCLELECMDGLSPASERPPVPAADRKLFAEGLAALPALARLKLDCFRSLSRLLGPALQALSTLTGLEMNEFGKYDWDGAQARPSLKGCFPDFSAMPSLQHLALGGDQIIGSKELRKMYSKGSTSIQSLELRGMQYKQLQAACEMINHVAPLTNLQLCVYQPSAGKAARTKYDQPLRHVLARHTQLQRLEVRAGLHSFVPWLASLPGLTQLALVCDHTGIPESTLQVVGGLTGLKKLELGPIGKAASCLLEGIEAARKLPLVEELQLCKEEQWTEQEVGLLLPPPGQLKRLVLASSSREMPTEGCWRAMEVMDRYDVRASMKRLFG
jgi:hypothetical protein